jgi:hypothetical protein
VVHEILGTYKFTDEKNKLVCTVEMNPSKALPSDAFVGIHIYIYISVYICIDIYYIIYIYIYIYIYIFV